MSKAISLFLMIGSPHGGTYHRFFGAFVVLFGVRVLFDAYGGVWRTGGIGWQGEPKNARWHHRIFLVLAGLCCLYIGLGLVSGVNSLPFVGPARPVIVNIFSGALAIILAGITLFGAYRVWKTGMVGFRGELIKAAWYHKALFPVLGVFFAGAAWVFLRRL